MSGGMALHGPRAVRALLASWPVLGAILIFQLGSTAFFLLSVSWGLKEQTLAIFGAITLESLIFFYVTRQLTGGVRRPSLDFVLAYVLAIAPMIVASGQIAAYARGHVLRALWSGSNLGDQMQSALYGFAFMAEQMLFAGLDVLVLVLVAMVLGDLARGEPPERLRLRRLRGQAPAVAAAFALLTLSYVTSNVDGWFGAQMGLGSEIGLRGPAHLAIAGGLTAASVFAAQTAIAVFASAALAAHAAEGPSSEDIEDTFA